MKTFQAIAFALTLNEASAFQAPATLGMQPAPVSRVRMSVEMPEVNEAVAVLEPPATPTPTPQPPKLPANSIAIPFAPRPPLLTGALAGDVGFDPMGFADTEENLAFYATAELKHARLAMLAAAGWPLAEMWHPGLTAITGLPSDLTEAGLAPSVLNGGLGHVAPFMLATLLAASALEMATMDSQSWGKKLADSKKSPGDYGFDPLGMYSMYAATMKVDRNGPNWNAAVMNAKKTMELAEIKNGRLAMLAITGFAFQEFATQQPVTEQTPFFFTPFWTFFGQMMGM